MKPSEEEERPTWDCGACGQKTTDEGHEVASENWPIYVCDNCWEQVFKP